MNDTLLESWVEAIDEFPISGTPSETTVRRRPPRDARPIDA